MALNLAAAAAVAAVLPVVAAAATLLQVLALVLPVVVVAVRLRERPSRVWARRVFRRGLRGARGSARPRTTTRRRPMV